MREKKATMHKHSHKPPSLRMGIYGPLVFHALLKHERNRVDRDGTSFALAQFDVTAAQANGFSERSICKILKKQMRTIDEIGWMDDSIIGVLLPSTDTEGGNRFASRACSAALAQETPLHYEVYSYPHHWIKPDKKGPPGSDGPNDEKGLGPKPPFSFNRKTPLWKRILDISLSLTACALLWPLFFAVAVFIKIVSPGPVFFRQKRVGLNGKTFNFIKFRSMKHGNNEVFHQDHIVDRIRSNSSMQKLDDTDPRIFFGAKFLRKSCIDELPQLYNILRGDMSLVGPRPCLPYESKEFLHWHNHRFDVLPGLTGLWQVSGKNKLTFLQMIRLDIYYSNNMSLWFDIKIILKTIPVVLALVTGKITGKDQAQKPDPNAMNQESNAPILDS